MSNAPTEGLKMKTVQADAQLLANEVVSLWQKGDSAKAKDICDKKISELLEKYAPATVAKNCQQIYRKAIIEKSGVTQYTQEPVCLFHVPTEILTIVNEATRDTVENQRDYLIPITYEMKDRLLTIGSKLVKTPVVNGRSHMKRAVGLMLLTGRRAYSEIFNGAEFIPVDSQTVEFIGQAKGGDEKRLTGYNIPVLGVDSETIASTQLEITNYISARPWWKPDLDDRTLTGNLKKQVQLEVDIHVDPVFNEVRKLMVVENLKPHDLRKIAASIAHSVYGQRQAFTAFAAGYLGHNSTNKITGKVRRDTKTSESYEKFVVVENLTGYTSEC